MTSLARLVFVESHEDSNYLTDEDQRMTLAYENLEHMPQNLVDSFAAFIYTLDITHNRFSQFGFLSEFVNLTSLIIDHNEVDAKTIFPEMPHLRLLWLNYNKVDRLFPFIQRLQNSCPDLNYLSLMGNPAAPSYLNGATFFEHIQYRLFVISWFPKLVHFDDRKVTTDQHIEAYRLFKRPLLERLSISGIIPRCLAVLPKKLAALFAKRNIVV